MQKWTYIVFGVIIGAALATTASAAAEEIASLIGKKVDGEAEVIVDGKKLQTQAIIIEGTSYAPVRAVGEAVGHKVDWEDGKVTLVLSGKNSDPGPSEDEVFKYDPATENDVKLIELAIGYWTMEHMNYSDKLNANPSAAEAAEWRAKIVEALNWRGQWAERLGEIDSNSSTYKHWLDYKKRNNL